MLLLQFQHFAIFIFIVVAGNAGASWAQGEVDSAYGERRDEPASQFGRQQYGGEMLIASATIMGFGGFVGLLAARFRGVHVRRQVACTMIIYRAILCKMVLHLFVILFLSRGVLPQSSYELAIAATMGLVATMVACFCTMTVLRNTHDADSSSVDTLAESSIRDADALYKGAVSAGHAAESAVRNKKSAV